MEDSKSLPFFRRIDQAIFVKIDSFKRTPNYNAIQDFYNSLEEEQQKLFKGLIILMIFLLPLFGLGMFWWQNQKFQDDLNIRTSIVSKSNEIIGQSRGLLSVTPQFFSANPIDSESMMTSRLSGLLSAVGVDITKIQIKDFASTSISGNVLKAEANLAFNNLSTDELMNLFTTLITREKFKISSVSIKKNSNTNMLQGQFHAVHFSSFSPNGEEEQ